MLHAMMHEFWTQKLVKDWKLEKIRHHNVKTSIPIFALIQLDAITYNTT